MSMPSIAFLSATFRAAWLEGVPCPGRSARPLGASGRSKTAPEASQTDVARRRWNHCHCPGLARKNTIPHTPYMSTRSALQPPPPRKLLPRLGGVHLAGLRLHLCGATLWRPGLGRGWRHLRPKGACSWAVGSEWEVRTTTDGAWCNCRGISFGMFWVLLLGGVL